MTATWLAEDLIWPDDRGTASPGDTIRLCALECACCQRCSFPAMGTCSWCGSAGHDRAVRPSGTLVASTAVLHRTPGSTVPVPYLVALVRFDEVRLDLIGRVVGTADPDSLPPGTAMTIIAESLSGEQLHYAFAAG